MMRHDTLNGYTTRDVPSLAGAVLEPMRILPADLPEDDEPPAPKPRQPRLVGDDAIMQKLNRILPGARVKLRDLYCASASTRQRVLVLIEQLPQFQYERVPNRNGPPTTWVVRKAVPA